MKVFTLSQTQEAQDWQPQIERFVMSDAIYVVETNADYDSLNASVQTIIDLKTQSG